MPAKVVIYIFRFLIKSVCLIVLFVIYLLSILSYTIPIPTELTDTYTTQDTYIAEYTISEDVSCVVFEISKYDDWHGLGFMDPGDPVDSTELEDTKETLNTELKLEVMPTIVNELSTAVGINSDVEGWVFIEDTNINYPILRRAGDNSFYLSHKLDGTYSAAGSVMLDKTSQDLESDVVFLQAHSSKSGQQFGQLLKYKERDWLLDHKFVWVVPTEGNVVEGNVVEGSIVEDTVAHCYEIFAVVLLNANTEGLQVAFKDSAERLRYFKDISERSLVELPLPVDLQNVLILSTCSYEGQNYRCVVFAARVGEVVQ